MAFPRFGWLIVAALVAAAAVIAAGVTLLRPPAALIESADFSLARITPNADGQDDITIFSYELSRTARITLVFEAADGAQYFFRQGERRTPGTYSVQFSGVVDGFALPGEEFPVSTAASPDGLQTRLLPDGVYTWTFTATDEDGESVSEAGTLEIAEGDPELPLIQTFNINPPFFTPNQDGLRDRVSVNVFLAKPADLSVYLEDPQTGVRIYLAQRRGGRQPGEAGNHEFDYDGGVDQGFRPPADGTYNLFAVAQDAEGQRFVRTGQLTIQDSGLPQVEIIPQPTGGTVCFEPAPYDDGYFTDAGTTGERIPQPTTVCSELTTLTLPVMDLLVFHLSIRNYGDTPVRTAGPFPGTVYQFDQRASSLGVYEESGAWRVGIDCDTAPGVYPWRWALASEENLTAEYDPEADETYYYLEAGQNSEVWGAVRLTEIVNARNPQFCWAGLIHEDVAVRQEREGAREIELVPR